MKILGVLSAITLVLGSACSQAATIDWWTITGGGGISQHGTTAIGGAIGAIAPSLSPATGGNDSLDGGFWSALLGYPQPASPKLSIVSLGGEKFVISWPIAVHGFVLEYTADLDSGAWMSEGEQVVDTLSEHTVTVPREDSSRCYRLRLK